jgi:uncharacterized RDD family membrane protein YckC
MHGTVDAPAPAVWAKGKTERRTAERVFTMTYARFWQRVTASIVDVFFLVLVAWPVSQAITSRPSALVVALLGPLLVPVYEVYFHRRWGQTLGKRLVNIVVLDAGGNRITARQAVLRSSVGLAFGLAMAVSHSVGTMRISDAEFAALDSTQIAARQQTLAPYAALLWHASNVWFASELVTMLFNRRRRALHDLIAGTVVVNRAVEGSLGSRSAAVAVPDKRAAVALVLMCCAPSIVGVTMIAVSDAWWRYTDRAATPASPFFEALGVYGLLVAVLGIPAAILALVIGVGVLRSDRPRTRAGRAVLTALATSWLAVSWLAWDTLRLIWF